MPVKYKRSNNFKRKSRGRDIFLWYVLSDVKATAGLKTHYRITTTFWATTRFVNTYHSYWYTQRIPFKYMYRSKVVWFERNLATKVHTYENWLCGYYTNENNHVITVTEEYVRSNYAACLFLYSVDDKSWCAIIFVPSLFLILISKWSTHQWMNSP